MNSINPNGNDVVQLKMSEIFLATTPAAGKPTVPSGISMNMCAVKIMGQKGSPRVLNFNVISNSKSSKRLSEN